MENSMQNKISSINERVFVLRDYRVPLFATTLSLEGSENKPFSSTIAELFYIPESDVIDFETWRQVNLRLTDVFPELAREMRIRPFRHRFWEDYYMEWRHWVEYEWRR